MGRYHLESKLINRSYSRVSVVDENGKVIESHVVFWRKKRGLKNQLMKKYNIKLRAPRHRDRWVKVRFNPSEYIRYNLRTKDGRLHSSGRHMPIHVDYIKGHRGSETMVLINKQDNELIPAQVGKKLLFLPYELSK